MFIHFNPQFNYKIHLVGDGQYGAPTGPDGAWTGMVRELIDRVSAVCGRTRADTLHVTDCVVACCSFVQDTNNMDLFSPGQQGCLEAQPCFTRISWFCCAWKAQRQGQHARVCFCLSHIPVWGSFPPHLHLRDKHLSHTRDTGTTCMSDA